MIRFKHHGDFRLTEKFLTNSKKKEYRMILERYGREGINALSLATPKDSGITANSWSYEILILRNGAKIVWTNSNLVTGVPVAILIQYGHGTRSGTFIEGKDFINPAMKPIFDKISETLWKEVTNL